MGRRFLPAARVFAAIVVTSAPVSAQDIVLATNAGGLTISGSKPSWSTGFGALNGLGLGTPAANVPILTPGGGGGALYTSPYNIVVSGVNNGHPGVVRAYVSANFSHPSILKVYSCSASCSNGSSYSALSTSPATPTDIIPSPGLSSSQTVTRSLGVFVSNQNGASAFTGADSATVSVLVYDDKSGSLLHTCTLSLNNPNENVQTALSFILSAAPGGRTILAASDFSLAFGNVNGLGIAPGTGLIATTIAGGELYSTPYVLVPSFSSFSSTTGAIKAYVSTDFGHPSQLELRDSSTGATYSAISKTVGSQTTLSASASSGSSITRYIGLFVSDANGATIFTGSDSATVTFTLVVP
jgi:hypothetical protein